MGAYDWDRNLAAKQSCAYGGATSKSKLASTGSSPVCVTRTDAAHPPARGKVYVVHQCPLPSPSSSTGGGWLGCDGMSTFTTAAAWLETMSRSSRRTVKTSWESSPQLAGWVARQT